MTFIEKRYKDFHDKAIRCWIKDSFSYSYHHRDYRYISSDAVCI